MRLHASVCDASERGYDGLKLNVKHAAKSDRFQKNGRVLPQNGLIWSIVYQMVFEWLISLKEGVLQDIDARVSIYVVTHQMLSDIALTCSDML